MAEETTAAAVAAATSSRQLHGSSFDLAACVFGAALFAALAIGMQNPVMASALSSYFCIVVGAIEWSYYGGSYKEKFVWMTMTRFLITEESKLYWLNVLLPVCQYFADHKMIYVVVLTVIHIRDCSFLKLRFCWNGYEFTLHSSAGWFW